MIMSSIWFANQRTTHINMIKSSKVNKGKTIKKIQVYHCTDCDDIWRKDDHTVPFLHDIFCLSGFKLYMQMITIAIPCHKYIEIDENKD